MRSTAQPPAAMLKKNLNMLCSTLRSRPNHGLRRGPQRLRVGLEDEIFVDQQEAPRHLTIRCASIEKQSTGAYSCFFFFF